MQKSAIPNSPDLWKHLFPWPKRDDHKYTRGHLLIVGGELPMSGAARLSALAAMRLCGMVTIACPESALLAYATTCPLAVLQPFRHAEELTEIAARRKCSALLIGPGAGATESMGDKVQALISLHLPTLLDADALTAFAGNPDTLFVAIRACTAPVVLTPHAGEFARLFGEIGADKIAATRGAALTSHSIVLLKGADTVIAAPDGRTIINSDAPPTLAVAGAGDVLSGMIAALLSAGMPAFEATACAAWLHGEAARSFGYGLTAPDLADAIPKALALLATL